MIIFFCLGHNRWDERVGIEPFECEEHGLVQVFFLPTRTKGSVDEELLAQRVVDVEGFGACHLAGLVDGAVRLWPQLDGLGKSKVPACVGWAPFDGKGVIAILPVASTIRPANLLKLLGVLYLGLADPVALRGFPMALVHGGEMKPVQPASKGLSKSLKSISQWRGEMKVTRTLKWGLPSVQPESTAPNP